MFNALLVTVFLILIAASAVVTASMILLTLFDLAFGKKGTPSVLPDGMDSEQLEPPSKDRVAESKLEPKPLAPRTRSHVNTASVDKKSGYGPQTQRIRVPKS